MKIISFVVSTVALALSMSPALANQIEKIVPNTQDDLENVYTIKMTAQYCTEKVNYLPLLWNKELSNMIDVAIKMSHFNDADKKNAEAEASVLVQEKTAVTEAMGGDDYIDQINSIKTFCSTMLLGIKMNILTNQDFFSKYINIR